MNGGRVEGSCARTHAKHIGRHARSHAGGHACTDTHVRHARRNAGNTSRDKALGPLPGTVLCRICRIRRSGNRRTGAQLQRERVDRAAGTSGIEVDAAVDCVPEAPSRVGFEAQTAPVRRVREAGRAHACRIVVEREKGRRADRAIRAQHERCKGTQTPARLDYRLSATRTLHSILEYPQGGVGYAICALLMCANASTHRRISVGPLTNMVRDNMVRARVMLHALCSPERCNEARRAATLWSGMTATEGAAIPLELEWNAGGVAAGPAVAFALPRLLAAGAPRSAGSSSTRVPHDAACHTSTSQGFPPAVRAVRRTGAQRLRERVVGADTVRVPVELAGDCVPEAPSGVVRALLHNVMHNVILLARDGRQALARVLGLEPHIAWRRAAVAVCAAKLERCT